MAYVLALLLLASYQARGRVAESLLVSKALIVAGAAAAVPAGAGTTLLTYNGASTSDPGSTFISHVSHRKLGYNGVLHSLSDSTRGSGCGGQQSDAEGLSLEERCTSSFMAGLWEGNVRRVHTSRSLFMHRTDKPHIRAMIKELRHTDEQSLEYEMMATNVNELLGLQVRPRTKGLLAVVKEHQTGMLSWLRSREDVLQSLASGMGASVVSAPCAECVCFWKKQAGLRLARLAVFEHLPGLENPKKQVYPLMHHLFEPDKPGDNMFLRSAAHVHLLNDIMSSVDQKGSWDYGYVRSSVGSAKNCFIDGTGKFWAVDFDISNLALQPRPSLQGDGNLEECLKAVWGHHVLGVPDLHCALLSIMHNKLVMTNFTDFEQEMYSLMKSQHFWEMTACPLPAKSKVDCLEKMVLPEFFRDYAKLPGFPWEAIVMHQPRDKTVSEDWICSIDVSMIWTYIIRTRTQTVAAKLEVEMNNCRVH